MTSHLVVLEPLHAFYNTEITTETKDGITWIRGEEFSVMVTIIDGEIDVRRAH